MKKALFLLLLLWFFANYSYGQQESSTLNYSTYCNSRFGYCVGYPEGILYPQPERDNSDGTAFKNKSGQNILTVYGVFDGVGKSLSTLFKEDISEFKSTNKTLTYKRLGKSFFVLSGYNKSKIFYQKTILRGGVTANAVMVYDRKDKALYDQVSEQVNRSLKYSK